MAIHIYTPKGGCFKTHIALSLWQDINRYFTQQRQNNIQPKYDSFKYITNDQSFYHTLFPNIRMLKKNVHQDDMSYQLVENGIYDWGGFSDPRVDRLINDDKSSLLIVPITPDANAIYKALNIIEKYKSKKIFLVATNIDNDKDFKDIKSVIFHHFPQFNHYDHPELGQSFFMLRRTKLFKNALTGRMSPVDLYYKDYNPKVRDKDRMYHNAYKDYNTFISKVVEFL